MSLADFARDRIIDKIVSLELEPGVAIVERDLLATLDLGRTPVREALQQVAGIGLVCRLPHIGMYVCEVTDDSVRDIYEIRSMMDGRTAELAARHANDQQVATIVATAKEVEAAYANDDLMAFTHAGRKFHRSLAQATGNLHVVELMPRMYNLDARLTWLANLHMGTWQVLGFGIVETTLSLAGVIQRKLPLEAKLLADLHVERRYSYFSSKVRLGTGNASYLRQA